MRPGVFELLRAPQGDGELVVGYRNGVGLKDAATMDDGGGEAAVGRQEVDPAATGSSDVAQAPGAPGKGLGVVKPTKPRRRDGGVEEMSAPRLLSVGGEGSIEVCLMVRHRLPWAGATSGAGQRAPNIRPRA